MGIRKMTLFHASACPVPDLLSYLSYSIITLARLSVHMNGNPLGLLPEIKVLINKSSRIIICKRGLKFDHSQSAGLEKPGLTEFCHLIRGYSLSPSDEEINETKKVIARKRLN